MTVHPRSCARTQQEGTGSGVMVVEFTSEQGGIHPKIQYLANLSEGETPRSFAKQLESLCSEGFSYFKGILIRSQLGLE